MEKNCPATGYPRRATPEDRATASHPLRAKPRKLASPGRGRNRSWEPSSENREQSIENRAPSRRRTVGGCPVAPRQPTLLLASRFSILGARRQSNSELTLCSAC